MRPLGHEPRLNGIRGIAVILVLLYHLWPGVAIGGFLGVDVFFVLSGFLITSLLVEEHAETGRIAFGRFYVRRALRLLPALWVALLVFLVVGFVAYDGAERHSMVVFVAASALDFANIAVVENMPMWAAHTWSLSAEEQFYLVWPAVLALLLAVRWLSPRSLVIGLVGLVVVLAVYRAARWSGTAGWVGVYYSPLTHSDGIVLGCALGLARTQLVLPVVTRGWLVAAAGLVGLGLVGAGVLALRTTDGALYTWGYPVVIVAAACAVWAASEEARPVLLSWLAWSPLVAMGRISYAVYIWSGLMLGYFAGGLLERLLGGAVVIVIATVSYFVVERPALRLKARFAPTRELASVVVEPART